MDPVLLGAEAYAGWHSVWLTAFGIPWAERDGVWIALDPAPFIYLAGITLRNDAAPEVLRDAPGAVLDSWCSLDLAAFGFEQHHVEAWYLREPEPIDDPDPPELEIAQVVDPADFPEFEDVSVRGFRGEDASTPMGSIHPPVSDPRLVNWIGSVDGVAVGAAMSYRSPHAVGVFGVTVIESARGRGYGTALTRRSLLLELGLPAILGPSPEAESMYRRLGFRHVGEARHWRRPGPVSRTEPEAVRT